MTVRSFCAIALAGALAIVAGAASSQGTYEPSPIFCYQGNAQSALCPVIPSGLDKSSPIYTMNPAGYNGIFSPQDSSSTDVQSAFDDMSWQTFVALNWTAGKEDQPPQSGLQGEGRRVWETDKWPRISAIFHDSPVLAKCNPPPGMPVFRIGANLQGQPDGHNEEYIQAATDQPLIDVKGNWTIYERRINGIEVAYLQAPNGNSQWNLTNLQGQAAFVGAKQTVSFPPFDMAAGINGAMEIKAAWRILDPADHAANAKRFYIVSGMLTVPSVLVFRGTKAIVADVCAKVDFGLVGMHILQKNPKINVLPAGNWIWSTFEHVDNAPLSGTACNVQTPWTCKGVSTGANNPCPPANVTQQYSFYDRSSPGAVTNQPPVNPNGPNKPFLWRGSMPFAYATPQGAPGTQVSRCWQIYQYTAYLNTQWRAKLAAVGSVFQNYMLVGTQWGAGADEPIINGFPVPMNATLPYLSNSVIETFMQLQINPQNGFATGSCIACHGGAQLKNQPPVVCNVLSDQSFVPGEAVSDLVRRPLTAQATPSCTKS
jgi:hypothetical protein